MAPLDVLVIGAGPTGLTMASELLLHGASVRIIDAQVNQLRESRAFGVQARTLELLDRRGLARDLISRGHTDLRLIRHTPGGRRAEIVFTDVGMRDTRFPFMLVVSQLETEDVLEAHLRSLGGSVERGVTLTGFAQDDAGVRAVISHPDGRTEQVHASYLVGADGAHSTVRQAAGIEFEGGTYEMTWFLADLDVDGPLEPGWAHAFPTASSITVFVPLGRPAPWRLMAVELERSSGAADTRATPTLQELQRVVERGVGLPLRLHSEVFGSRFRTHHRMAQRFRAGRVFLAGDAGHIHSPLGAQGMNTGIQDAWNLAWKLALVVRGHSPGQLLDSYEAERMPVARHVLGFTDRLFAIMVSQTWPARLWRGYGLPVVTALAARSRPLRRRLFRRLSQLEIEYRDSPVSQQATGGLRPRAGQRLPDIELPSGQGWVHEQLDGPRYHLLVCEPPADPVGLAQLQRRYDELVAVRRLPAGTWGGGVVLVRPDGYIAFRGTTNGPELGAYLQRWLQPPVPKPAEVPHPAH
jgi:2-polyprenyl-6-methoxyphenol hydroxylase-like FAD-dependent oxidoreductase